MTTAANNKKEFELPGEHLAVFQIIANSKEKYGFSGSKSHVAIYRVDK